MDKLPSTEPRLLEMLDCCRPNSDDRNDPMFADLAAELRRSAALALSADRIETVDAKLVAAFQDVAVPDGLCERILTRLAGAELDFAVETETEARPMVVRVPDLREPAGVSCRPSRRPSRRLWLAGAISAIAAACLVAAIVPSLRKPNWRQSEILDETVALFTSEGVTEGRTDAPPAEYPFSRDLLRLRGTQWRYVEGMLCCGGVAYDLPAIDGSRATLYVLRAHGKDLPASAPSQPVFNTGDCSVAAWQDGELLYILAVRGGTRAYQSYLDLRGGPMAVMLFPGAWQISGKCRWDA